MKIQLTKQAAYTLLILKTLTTDTLEYNIQALLKYIPLSESTLPAALSLLVECGYIEKTRNSIKLLQAAKDVVYPKFMTLPLNKTYLQNISVVHFPSKGKIKNYDKLSEVIFMTDDQYMAATLKQAIQQLTQIGVEFNASLFEAAEYICQDLTTVVVRKSYEDLDCAELAQENAILKEIIKDKDDRYSKEMLELKEEMKALRVEILDALDSVLITR